MDWLASFFAGIINNYAQFFSVEAFLAVITNPLNWGIIGTLIILEGLLSADNALVLAVMVKHLPDEQKKRALFYGILGAFGFRLIAIGLGTFLIKIWWIKILGGAYLLWLVIQYFFFNKEEDEAGEGKSMSFWRTVLAVEMMDIAFSVDSILAAFGVSDKIWVLYLGGILGILMMRGVAQIFLVLIEKFPELETTAYLLISVIGLKMIAAAFGFHLDEKVFFAILITLFLGTFVLHHIRAPKKGSAKEGSVHWVKNLDESNNNIERK